MIDPASQSICTSITLWRKDTHLRLHTGIIYTPDLFQEKISDSMERLEFINNCLEDLLCPSRGKFDEHLEDVEEVLVRL